jgi:type IV secretory pathway ATPase VirB11/archaellum biosynthesis ATPase
VKAEVYPSSVGITINLHAETPQDASQLVRLKMNARAETNEVLDVICGESGVVGNVYLLVSRDRTDAGNRCVESRVRRTP